MPPPGKSGAMRVSAILCSGSRISAAVVSHTSARLKEQILLAMPTAMPVLLFTSTEGKVTGNRVGSFTVLS